jgi:hypothetical protein
MADARGAGRGGPGDPALALAKVGGSGRSRSIADPLWLLAAVLMFFVTSRFRVCHVVPWLAVIALGLDVAVRSWRTHAR